MTPNLFPEPSDSPLSFHPTDAMRWIGDSLAGAVFDETKRYRLTLWRRWVESCPVSRMVAYIGLNPSTADEMKLDNTTKKCVKLAKSWGFDGFIMLNIFAWRDTNPKLMKKTSDPIGYENDIALAAVSRAAGMTVCAWGTHGVHLDRNTSVRALLAGNSVAPFHLGLTKDGHPKHPLFLKTDGLQPTSYPVQKPGGIPVSEQVFRLGLSSDHRTGRWRITCPECGKQFEPVTTMRNYQVVSCPIPKCSAELYIDYGREKVELCNP